MTLQIHSSRCSPFVAREALLQPGSSSLLGLDRYVGKKERPDILSRCVGLMGDVEEIARVEHLKRNEEEVTRANKKVAEEISRPPQFRECSDLINLVSEYLDTPEVIDVASVCNQWNEFLRDTTENRIPRGVLAVRKAKLRKYVKEHGFGALKWEKYFGQVVERGKKSKLPLNVLDVLDDQCPFSSSGRTVGQTHILFYLPQTVDGEPLTLNRFESLVQNPKPGSGGHPTRYRHFSDDVKRQYGDQASDAPRWVLMSRDIIPGSRNKLFPAQCKLIPPGFFYTVPKVLQAVAGVFLHYVDTGERLFTVNPLTHTRCHETLDGGRRGVVGGFDLSGLSVYFICFDYERIGVAVLREFSGT